MIHPGFGPCHPTNQDDASFWTPIFLFERKKFIKCGDKPGAGNKLYRKLYIKIYKKCGDKGTTVGGDHGKETVDIAVPFFVNALKS